MRAQHPIASRQFVPFAASSTRFVPPIMRSVLFLLPVLFATLLTTTAIGEPFQEPRIVEFTVQWDGIDQYFVSGRVVDVDEIDDLEVTFGDTLAGITTRTNPDGTFSHLAFLDDAHSDIFSATVTSRDGVVSASVWNRVW